jgi:hypothetical protein
MTLKGCHFACTDVGNASPWYFYLQRLPNMFGGAIALLPFIIWDSLLKLNALPKKWIVYPGDVKTEDKNWKTFIVKAFLLLLNGQSKEELDTARKDRLMFVFLWAFLPLFLLSFSAIKEVTYLLPSYVAIAILCGEWLNERINTSEDIKETIRYFVVIVVPVAIASSLLAPSFTLTYIIAASVWMGGYALLAAAALIKMRFARAAFIICGIILCGIILGNTPAVMRKTRLNRKCHLELAEYVFDRIGNKKLYVFGGCETLRGSMLYYGTDRVCISGSTATMKKVLSSGQGDFYIIITKNLKILCSRDKELARLLKRCRVKELPFSKLSDDYTLIQAPVKDAI